VPFLRDGNARADVITHPQPALALGYGSEDVKAALEPVIEAVGDLDGLVLGVFDPSIVKLLWSSTIVCRGSTRSDPYTWIS
jgi:hypothetical protein